MTELGKLIISTSLSRSSQAAVPGSLYIGGDVRQHVLELGKRGLVVGCRGVTSGECAEQCGGWLRRGTRDLFALAFCQCFDGECLDRG